MKIQNTSLFQYPVKAVPFQRLNSNTAFDTFENSNQSKTLNFKGGTQNIYKKVLENPSLAQKFTALMTMAIATLVAGATSDDNTETTSPEIENNPEMETILGNMLNQKAPESISDNTDEVAALKKENRELKATIETLKRDLSPKSETDNQTEEASVPVIAQKFSVNFPKKIGRLTSEQINLKTVTGNIYIDKEYAEKLEQICSELLNNKELENKKSITDLLCEDLKAAKNDKEIADIINNYYNIVFPPAVTDEDKQKTAEFIPVEVPVIGVNVVDKIELSPKDANKPRIDRKPQNKEPEKPVAATLVYHTDSTESANKETKIPDTAANKTSDAYSYKRSGVLPRDLMSNLTPLYLKFQNLVFKKAKEENEFIHWSRHDSVCVADKNSILYELRNNKKDYKNLKPEQAEQLADLINSDKRFQSYFTSHGILRLIERFVDFENYDKTPEEQLTEVVEALEIMVKRSIIKGSMKAERHNQESKTGKNYIGLRIQINDTENRTNKELEYFGDSIITLGICEDSKGHVHNKKQHAPVIHTVFIQDDLEEV